MDRAGCRRGNGGRGLAGGPVFARRARRRRGARHRRAAGPMPHDLSAAAPRSAQLSGDHDSGRRVARHREVADVARDGAAQDQARFILRGRSRVLQVESPMINESDLLRLVEGDCVPGEAAAIQAWSAADPRREALLHDLRALWRATGTASRDWNAAAARERLLRARRLFRIAPAAPSPPPVWATRIAVAVALMVAGALSWYLRPANLPPSQYSSPAGQLSALHLSDGSRAVLGVATRLRVPRDYGARVRAVELDGEAYFVVRHDPAHPFLVRTAHGTTEDLGTEFDVRAYREERSLQVVVALGRVALRRAGGADSLLLHPRDRGVIDATGMTIISGVSLQH